MAEMWPSGTVITVLSPELKGLAWVGRASGREKKLVSKYWG
jgi:hypothetical protein